MVVITEDKLHYLNLCEKELSHFRTIKYVCPKCDNGLIFNGYVCSNCGYDDSNVPSKEYEIWIEGYAASGDSGKHQLLGTCKGKSFRNAVLNWVESKIKDMGFVEFTRHYGNFNRKELTLWGCRLFPTEEESAKSFG